MNDNVIANNLVMYRKEKNLTQLELSEIINYSDKVISKWERSESIPGIEALKIIADFYNVTVDDLISEKNGTVINTKSNIIKMTQVRGASIVFKWSILIPFLIWMLTIGRGPEWFILGGLLFLVWWIIYSLTVIVSEYSATFEGHEIKVTTSPKGIKMYIDTIIVDSTGVPLLVNYVLTGKIGTARLKARIVLFFGTKCTMFVE